MTANPKVTVQPKVPTRKNAMIFRVKTALLQGRRLIVDGFDGRIKKHSRSNNLIGAPVTAISRSLLWTETQPEERFLVAGKIHNLRLAIRRLDGVEIAAGEVFSFWKQLGRAGRMGGYVVG